MKETGTGRQVIRREMRQYEFLLLLSPTVHHKHYTSLWLVFSPDPYLSAVSKGRRHVLNILFRIWHRTVAIEVLKRRQMDGWMDGWTGGWMDWWMDGQTDRKMHDCMHHSAPLCGPTRPGHHRDDKVGGESLYSPVILTGD